MDLAVKSGLGRTLRARLIIAIVIAAVVAAFAVGMSQLNSPAPAVGGTIEVGHKAGHGEPPACQKRAPYGKYPKKQCPSRGTDGGQAPKGGKNK